MENLQFKSDSNVFRCMECDRKIRVINVAANKPRPVTCKRCGTEYEVLKRTSGTGLQIMLKTASEPDAASLQEAEMEEEDVENEEEEK